MLKYIGIISIVAIAPGVLLACPTTADLAKGIRVTESDGLTSVFRSQGPGVVAVSIDFGAGDAGENLLAQGVYVLRLSTTQGGVVDFNSIYETTYAMAPEEMPPPTAGLTQTLPSKITSVSDSYDETQTQTWGALENITIGGCDYQAINGTVSYASALETFVETILYLPEVGIGLLTSYQVSGQPAESYEVVKIEAVE